ncbi:hypothetical protein L596_026210 [Steinernema carpocapsae]|uniref:SCP domain-containing protein n=1 Tax=Steinernema carpocapsae TaxID=34508 RepID=A0A4U5M0P1_STECR|nr:hypothetical protein L596_026210 [Steinernema carpocapsae]
MGRLLEVALVCFLSKATSAAYCFPDEWFSDSFDHDNVTCLNHQFWIQEATKHCGMCEDGHSNFLKFTCCKYTAEGIDIYALESTRHMFKDMLKEVYAIKKLADKLTKDNQATADGYVQLLGFNETILPLLNEAKVNNTLMDLWETLDA